MAFANVQTVGGTATTQNLTITVTGTIVGNVVTMGVSVPSAETGAGTVTDGAGNTYARATMVAATGHDDHIFYGCQAGSTTAVTSNIDASRLQHCGASEFSGGQTTNAAIIGQTSTGSGNGTAVTVGSFTPTTGSLVVSFCRNSAAPSYSVSAPIVLGATTSRSCTVWRLSASGAETMPVTQATGDWGAAAVELFALSAATTVKQRMTLMGVGC